MKYLLLCITITLAAACAKSSGSAANDSLVGAWRMIRYTGGIAGVDLTLKPENRNTLITFSQDSLYRVFNNNTLIFECRYTETTEAQDGETIKVLNIKRPEFLLKNRMTLHNDTLYLVPLEIKDAFNSYYIREE
ncbi:hypothetical protein [Filimonas effusa]|uniref:Lipocalin-like domain-containing protein n=1 Tax=Filimonas effusa TaxID=2508721 RepID=A0A4Q1DAW0_9BACT|nr:hypothetical protein [Filimonas effusa]RXK85703.1 hypothetical protein ESB13_02490 [Filimonas effusa]